MTDDGLLTDGDVESALSVAYVHAIAAEAGYTCGEPPGPDRDSVDIQISAGGAMRPKLDLQLKATVRLTRNGEAFLYPLKVKNYGDLRVETQTPRLLIVLDLPPEKERWLTVSVEELVIRRAAYWTSLLRMPATANTSAITILIPIRNIFDVSALRGLMEQSRQGRIA